MKNIFLVYISCMALLFCSFQNASASHSWDEEIFSNSVLIDGIDHKHNDTIYRLYIHHPSNSSINVEMLRMRSLPDYNSIPNNFDLTFLYESKIKQIEDIMVTNPNAEASVVDNLLIILHKTSFKVYFLKEIGRDQRIILDSDTYVEQDYIFNWGYGGVSELDIISVSDLDKTGIQLFYLYQTESSDYSYPDDYVDTFDFDDFYSFLESISEHLGLSSLVLLSSVTITFMFVRYRKAIFEILNPSQKV